MKKCFRIRVAANLEDRVANGAGYFGVVTDEAKRRALHRESRREDFVRQSLNADIADPHHYNLILNVTAHRRTPPWKRLLAVLLPLRKGLLPFNSYR